MIREKDMPSLYRGAPSSALEEADAGGSPPAITYSGVLQDIFRARQQQNMGNQIGECSTCSPLAAAPGNDSHHLAKISLAADTMASNPSLFCRSDLTVSQALAGWKSSSLVEQL